MGLIDQHAHRLHSLRLPPPAASGASRSRARALRNAAFFAYANNYLIDVKFGISGRRGFARHPAG